jgi:hypothetical protein
MHWITLIVLRDLYLYTCRQNKTDSNLTDFIKAIRKYIKFILDIRGKVGIVTKTGIYVFEKENKR